MIDSTRVTDILLNCLYRAGELVNGVAPTEAVKVQGIQFLIYLHPDRLAIHQAEIVSMLAQLPSSFMKDKGGGMSFLAACNLETGEQWTGFHEIMDELFMLGQAIGKVKLLLPRDMWHALPGGMPYYQIDLS